MYNMEIRCNAGALLTYVLVFSKDLDICGTAITAVVLPGTFSGTATDIDAFIRIIMLYR